MALSIVPTCDICFTQKKETNAWFVVFFRLPGKGLGRFRFIVYDWTMGLAKTKGAKHICGEGCLSTLQSRNLQHRTRRS